jgi:RNA polymerase sigma-70 factor (ECF subfamily)
MSQSFHQTLISHLPKLRTYALHLTRSVADAEDLLQTTALLALRAERQFEMGTSFGAWSYRIMRNSFLGGCRSNKAAAVCIDDVDQELLGSHDPIEDRIFAHEVVRAMDKLTPKSRKTLSVICGGDLSYEEATTALSCTIGTVKSRLWRARRELEANLMSVGDVGRFSRVAQPNFANV